MHDCAKSFVLRSYSMHDLHKTFLLVSFSVSSKQLLCFVHSQGQKREEKPTTKHFVKFHNNNINNNNDDNDNVKNNDNDNNNNDNDNNNILRLISRKCEE